MSSAVFGIDDSSMPILLKLVPVTYLIHWSSN